MIHTEIYGSGQPIVLIHGWAMHSGIWRNFAQQLAEHYQVICVDLPGHGRSQKLPEFTLAAISYQISKVLPEQTCTVLGWSLGSIVALDLASRFPHKINKLVLMAGNPCFVKKEDWAGMKLTLLENLASNLIKDCRGTLVRFLSLQVVGLPDYKILLKELKQAVQACEPPEQEVLQGGLAILQQHDLRSQLAKLHCPVTAILGGLDTLVPVAVGAQMQALQPKLQLKIIERAGHLPFLSHQTELLSLLTAFMEQPHVS